MLLTISIFVDGRATMLLALAYASSVHSSIQEVWMGICKCEFKSATGEIDEIQYDELADQLIDKV